MIYVRLSRNHIDTPVAGLPHHSRSLFICRKILYICLRCGYTLYMNCMERADNNGHVSTVGVGPTMSSQCLYTVYETVVHFHAAGLAIGPRHLQHLRKFLYTLRLLDWQFISGVVCFREIACIRLCAGYPHLQGVCKVCRHRIHIPRLGLARYSWFLKISQTAIYIFLCWD